MEKSASAEALIKKLPQGGVWAENANMHVRQVRLGVRETESFIASFSRKLFVLSGCGEGNFPSRSLPNKAW